jgi:hypothetical protein
MPALFLQALKTACRQPGPAVRAFTQARRQGVFPMPFFLIWALLILAKVQGGQDLYLPKD